MLIDAHNVGWSMPMSTSPPRDDLSVSVAVGASVMRDLFRGHPFAYAVLTVPSTCGRERWVGQQVEGCGGQQQDQGRTEMMAVTGKKESTGT